jgi:hypothetical protein
LSKIVFYDKRNNDLTKIEKKVLIKKWMKKHMEEVTYLVRNYMSLLWIVGKEKMVVLDHAFSQQSK